MLEYGICAAYNNYIAFIFCLEGADWAGGAAWHRRPLFVNSQNIILCDKVLFHPEDSLIEADIHLLRFPFQEVAVVQRNHRTDHNVQTGDEIGQRKRRADRRTIRITGQIGHAGKRLQRGAQAGQMGIWSGLAVSCYMGDNNIGICLAKDIDAESPFVESPCSEIFNYNITLGAVSYTHLDVYKRQRRNHSVTVFLC